MLHTENWQGGQKGLGALILFVTLLLLGCNDERQTTVRQLSFDGFASLRYDRYALDVQTIRGHLEHILRADTDDAGADRRTRAYYREAGPFVWIDRQGVDERADTLLAELRRRLTPMGFSERSFRLQQIEADLRRIRTLDFDSLRNNASAVAARLEYNLTKAYLRYVQGQRFGFVNPDRVLNRLDAQATDSTGRPLAYRQLFDVDIEVPGKYYEYAALRKVTTDSLADYLAEVVTTDSLYRQLLQMLPGTTGAQRERIMVNMERRRWREKRKAGWHHQYVVVNVPAYHLWAVSPDTIVDMRAACGARKTKTPLLNSYITRMDVNPEWLIPMSIIQNDVARHAGDPGYFARHRYYIADRKTGQHVAPEAVTQSMLYSGKYRVAQQGGAGNALGRIIFRFPNNFSVFLHDTSSRNVFGRDDRGVSHGCVRVQHPFQLARFLLGPKTDEWLLDRLRISMGMPPETERGQQYMAEQEPGAQPRLLRSQDVPARVPLFITYYTLFPVPGAGWQTFPDVYDYDRALAAALQTYQK